MSIHLAWEDLQSQDSRYKGRAYEAANILAHEYVSRHIPAENSLENDLFDMLPLLADLYGAPLTPTEISGYSGLGARAARAAGRKRLSDPGTRTKIELWAEDCAVHYFTQQGWQVKRVGSEKRGYDLERTKQGGQILHVEVKGTQTRGEKVVLTGNGVKHNRKAAECEAEHALYVVSDIDVSRDDDIKCSGGEILWILPWKIDESDLIETQYSYSVPRLKS